MESEDRNIRVSCRIFRRKAIISGPGPELGLGLGSGTPVKDLVPDTVYDTGGFREELQSSFASKERSVKMQKTDMKALAVSIGKEAWLSDDGAAGVARPAGPSLGKRVPWGASFAMGVHVAEAMKTSHAHGVRKVDFCTEVREKHPRA